jgi:hypothetical protein
MSSLGISLCVSAGLQQWGSIRLAGRHNPMEGGKHRRTQMFTTLPPLYWLVKHDRDKLSLKPVCDPQGDDGPRVLLFYVEVVEYHGLGRREDAGVVVARREAQ